MGSLQLGIPIETWQQSDEKDPILNEMQKRIVAIKKETPCFLTTYIHLLHKSHAYATKK